jgi:hypothetical protein
MRALFVLVAAMVLGLGGGYAWSVLRPAPVHRHVPKAVTLRESEIPQTESDKEWAARGAQQGPPEIETSRTDPVTTEQSVYYGGCNEVRAAGKAPLRVGEPGYRAEMDGDGDGIACEPYHGN